MASVPTAAAVVPAQPTQLVGGDDSPSVPEDTVAAITAELKQEEVQLDKLTMKTMSEEDLKVVFDHEGEPFDCSDTGSFSYYNSFRDAIDAFYDNIAEGDWTLKIGDHGPGDVGILNNWSLELCFEEIELSNGLQ